MVECLECGKEYLDGKLESDIRLCPTCLIKNNGFLDLIKKEIIQPFEYLRSIIRNISEIREIRKEISAVKRDMKGYEKCH